MDIVRHQVANCKPATREKARRLIVETINAQGAFVVGDTDTYLVTFHDLGCACQASRRGLRCSHVLAALRERAILRGFTHTAFLHSMAHALSYADMQRGLGRTAVSHTSGRYHWVEFASPEPVQVPADADVLGPIAAPTVRPVRSFADIQAAADSLFA